MQLLKITTTPMKYELETTPARLEYKQDFLPHANTHTTPSELKIKTKPAELRLDTYEARKSLGFATIRDRVRMAAEKSLSIFAQNIRRTVEEGKQMAKIEDGVTIGQIIRDKMLQQPQIYTAFLPSTGADISWEPPHISVENTAGSVEFDWQIEPLKLQYIPGSVEMRIIEYAHVDIEYLGSPMYIPPSADPNYEESSDAV